MERRYFPAPANDYDIYVCHVLSRKGVYIRNLKGGQLMISELYKEYPNLIRQKAPVVIIEAVAQIIAETEDLSPMEQSDWILNQPLYQDGEILKMGSLYNGSILLPVPSDPTFNGDLQQFSSAMTIGNTKKGHALQFIAIKIDGKQLFVCDRAIANEVSKIDLDKQNFIYGKKITIDGKPYLLRALYGDEYDEKLSEWNKMLDVVGASNQIWHWQNMWTICRDGGNTYLRGLHHSFGWSETEVDKRSNSYGWRPVLEPL